MTSKPNAPRREAPPHDADPLALVARRASDARDRLGQWTDQLARETRKHPLGAVGVALGVGFVLGGGLFSRLAARLVGAGVRLGLRLAIPPLVAQGLIALADLPPHSHDDDKTRRRTHEAQ